VLKRLKQTPTTRAAGSAYGVGLVFEASDPDLLQAMLDCTPPAWTEGGAQAGARTFSVASAAAEEYSLARDGHTLLLGDEAEVLEELERNIRMQLAYNAAEHFFLHAGAVALNGRGIIVPGSTFSGKTSLVTALVRAGATYYSDENAVLDTNGMLHPYPKPLGLRLTEGLSVQTPHHVSELGGVSGAEPVQVALVVVTEYRPGAGWDPAPLSPAETVQVLLKHTFRGLDRPAETLAAMHRAAQDAVGLLGDRGEAAETAAMLIKAVAAAAPRLPPA